MAHHIFEIPEIVANILQTQAHSSDFLRTTLVLNHLFYNETARIIWKEVQPRHNHLRKAPTVPDLLAILAAPSRHGERNESLKRAQHYARWITSIDFAWQYYDRKGDVDINHHHVQLSRLAFPALTSLRFSINARDKEVQCRPLKVLAEYNHSTDRFIVSRLTSRLQHLVITQLPLMTSEIFYQIPKLAPHLVSAAFHMSADWHSMERLNLHISTTSLLYFVKNMPSLKTLHLRHGWSNWRSMTSKRPMAWSPAVLAAMLSHPNLQDLSLADIPFDWPLESMLERIQNPFQGRPTKLAIGCSSSGLRALARYLPQLQDLSLHCVLGGERRSRHEFRHGFRHLYHFSQLRHLTFNTFQTEARIQGHHIVRLAQHCTNLIKLVVLPRDGDTSTSIVGFGDEEMEIMARCLPKLQSLCLGLCARGLTHVSFIALGQFCKELQRIELVANINLCSLVDSWHAATATPESSATASPTFSNLHSLSLLGLVCPDLVASLAQPEELAQQVTSLVMPELSTFIFKGAASPNQDLESFERIMKSVKAMQTAVNGLLRARRRGGILPQTDDQIRT